MLEYEEYESAVRRYAEEMLPERKSEIFVAGLEGSDLAEACVSFRHAVATQAELDGVEGYLEMGFFGRADEERQKAWWLLYFDICRSADNYELENACSLYMADQPLFVGAPALYGAIRRRQESGSPDYELIDNSAIRCFDDSEVYHVGAGYAKLVPQLDPRIPVWARANFPGAPLFLRLNPWEYHAERPPLLMTEAAIVPADPKWIRTLGLFPDQQTFACYELQPDEDRQQYSDYHVHDLRRLEVSATRDKPDYLSMLIEELPRAENPNGVMVGRCIHLDTRAPVGTRMAEAELQHLDLAINIYRDGDRALRMANTLKRGKCQDATYRTHLLRIENIPFPQLFMFAQMFLRSGYLLAEWMAALGIGPSAVPPAAA